MKRCHLNSKSVGRFAIRENERPGETNKKRRCWKQYNPTDFCNEPVYWYGGSVLHKVSSGEGRL